MTLVVTEKLLLLWILVFLIYCQEFLLEDPHLDLAGWNPSEFELKFSFIKNILHSKFMVEERIKRELEIQDKTLKILPMEDILPL